MGSRKDSMDTKFEEDMQKALALSMESHALEKFRHSKIEDPPKLPQRRQTQPVQNPPSLEPPIQRRKHNSFTEIKSRPRPNPIFRPSNNSGAASTIPSVPSQVPQVSQVLHPKLPPRGNQSLDSDDLMSFNAPNQRGLMEKLDALYEQKGSLVSMPSNGFNNAGSTSSRFNLGQQQQVPTPPQRNFMSPQHTVQPPPPDLRPMTKSISWTGDLNQVTFSPTHNRLIHSSGSTIGSHRNIKSSNSDYSIVSITSRKPKTDLIDLGEEEPRILHTRVSVLEAFDPLMEEEFIEDKPDAIPEHDDNQDVYNSSTLSESSFYEAYDPFEYMVTKTQREADITKEVKKEPIYATPNKKRHSRQSSVSGADVKTLERMKKRKADYENVVIKDSMVHLVKKEKDVASDAEIQAFVDMVTKVRSRYKFDDLITNKGIMISPQIKSSYPKNTSMKLIVSFARCLTQENSVQFTCDVTSNVDHIIATVTAELEQADDPTEYLLQVAGVCEYLDHNTALQDYEYVHQCYKFDQDVQFVLVPASDLIRTLQRSEADDSSDSNVKIEDISPLDQVKKLSYSELKILLETLEKESVRMSKMALQLADCSDKEVMSALRPKQMIQSVKAITIFLGQVETIEISEICETLVTACLEFDKAKGNEDPSGKLRPEIVEEVGEKYATVIIKAVTNVLLEHAKKIQNILQNLKDCVQKLVDIYAKSFRVNFSMELNNDAQDLGTPKETIHVQESLCLRICALHRLPADWKHDEYCVSYQIYHGTKPIAEPIQTVYQPSSKSFFDRVLFDAWLESNSVLICSLPREARLVLTLYARDVVTEDKQKKIVHTELGWTSLQLFNFERFLSQGTFLLNLWPSEAEKQIGPAPDSGSHPYADKCPLLSIELPNQLGHPVIFPVNVPFQSPPRSDYNFQDLDYYTQQELLDVCDQDFISFTELRPQDREVLWEKRHYLGDIPGALPKVLLAANNWDFASLPGLYGLLKTWTRPEPMDVLQLFLPCFPDTYVREVAISWLKEVSNDDFVDYLPQLLEALKHETWSASNLAKLMLERSLESPRVSHNLYWLLAQSLPGLSPQNTLEDPQDRETKLKLARYRRRLQMLMRALYTISGSAMRKAYLTQQELLQHLNTAAQEVKTSKDSSKLHILRSHMEKLHLHLQEMASPLPLSLGCLVSGVDVERSSYFPSNTVPLKVSFISNASSDASSEDLPPTIPAIYKVGDDLRQDQLTIQMIRIMDKLWLRDGLDLKMVTFACVPTGDRSGIIELVTEAKTLREIQVMGNRGVTGSFKDTPISDYLVKHNPSQLEFARAVNNFTRSCAGYSVITYILGICDRHNDNIMVKQSGHLFHIDFGKFLGDAQMFGNFKRDRTPFVLTPDMVYVINGGEKMSQKFHDFVDLCCKSFNIIRKNGNLLLNLFTLMASSGIPGVTMDAVSYVQKSLLPDLSPAEAAAHFSRMIEDSLSSWFTQWNFFFHNLAQKRHPGDQNETDSINSGELLSFIPKTYSLESDGRITDVVVYSIQKRYTPEKHYVFILKITRESVKEPTYVFRTYKEFCELDSKLHTAFPTSGCHSLPKGSSLGFGRTEVQAVAEQRKHEIARFLDSLFARNISISQSDLVYTFFHPLLRDQQEADIHLRKLREDKGQRKVSSVIKGELKLSLEYRRDVLHVMVNHARSLDIPDGSKEEPNSYVKVYLRPDPHKTTKRKTRVVRKNCHPSFMEMLEYRMPLDIVRCRTLQATIWDCDRFQENMFLGAVTIPLNDLQANHEVTKWYPLTNYNRI